MKRKPLWAIIALAVATAIVAFVTSMLSGCAVAIHARIATWAATDQHQPPDVPTWAPPRSPGSSTKPAEVDRK